MIGLGWDLIMAETKIVNNSSKHTRVLPILETIALISIIDSSLDTWIKMLEANEILLKVILSASIMPVSHYMQYLNSD